MRNWSILVFLILFSFCATAQTDKTQETTFQKEAVKKQKIKVFPNPATNVVNVLGLKNSERAEISVSDIYGNVVLNHRWEIKNKSLNIPISSLNSGIYVIRIRSEEQSVQTKFYKQ